MKKILITGARGNVGMEVIKALNHKNGDFIVIPGVRDIQTDSNHFASFNIETVLFDFEDMKSIASAMDHCDVLFLLRPPQLADVKKYFAPLIQLAKDKKVQHIVFLSVQGVETSSLIPHHKIEKLILESGIPYTFLRPAYFMQNFTTTLYKDLRVKSRIYLPAGNAKFNLIDVKDVGAVAAEILINPKDHINKAYDLTNKEQLTFQEMANTLAEVLQRKIIYKSPNLLSFYLTKKREKMPSIFILVMIMLHFLPRFKATPSLSQWVQKITGKKPISFQEFVDKNRSLLK